MPDSDPASPSPRTFNVIANMVTGPTVNFVVQFWGVRGKVSAPGKETVRYGGNTSCVEMRVGSKRLIFDGGSGLRLLGNHLLRQMPLEAYLFFTHCHWDSIQGFPFFTPAFIPGNCFHIYGAKATNGESIEKRLGRQMLAPNFPVPLQVMQSELKFYELGSGDKITVDDLVVETVLLNAASHSMGYRITWNGHSVVYAIAYSQSPDQLDQNLLHLARHADLLILDAPCNIRANDSLKPSPLDWQDQLGQTGLATAKAAGVKRIVMSHYHPDHDDEFLEWMESQVKSVFPNDVLAREGMVIPIC